MSDMAIYHTLVLIIVLLLLLLIPRFLVPFLSADLQYKRKIV